MKNISNSKSEPLLEVQNLKMHFKITGKGTLHAVDDVSFSIYPGETVSLVGESGCGKSTVGNVIMRLLDRTDGKVFYQGKNIYEADKKESMEICKKMQIIFQDPYSSLNPKKTIRQILGEAFQIHKIKGKEKENRILELCDKTGIPHNLLDYFPHELDGGMRQIVGITRALSMSPGFIVCDEPISALDVSVQAKIINLLIDLQKDMNLSYLFISHDLSVVRHVSDRIMVMYLGQIVEMADTDEIFANTMHPYSVALLSAVPRVNLDGKVRRIVLKGDVPSPMDPKPGCRFAPRCWMADKCCTEKTPELREIEPNHYVACHFAELSRERAKTAVTTGIMEQREETK